MFKVFIHKKVEKRLYKLPKHILRKISELISILETNPVPWKSWDVRKLTGEEDIYRIRLNKYRIVYWINWKEKEIILLKVELRKKVYK